MRWEHEILKATYVVVFRVSTRTCSKKQTLFTRRVLTEKYSKYLYAIFYYILHESLVTFHLCTGKHFLLLKDIGCTYIRRASKRIRFGCEMMARLLILHIDIFLTSVFERLWVPLDWAQIDWPGFTHKYKSTIN